MCMYITCVYIYIYICIYQNSAAPELEYTLFITVCFLLCLTVIYALLTFIYFGRAFVGEKTLGNPMFEQITSSFIREDTLEHPNKPWFADGSRFGALGRNTVKLTGPRIEVKDFASMREGGAPF